MTLATRLALGFALVATLPLLAVAPLVLREVTGAFEVELDRRLAAAVRAVETEQKATGAAVVRALDAVAGSELLRTVAIEPIDGGDPAALVSVAGEMMEAGGLEVLALLDDEGRILSSGHLPARVGDPDLASLALSRIQPSTPVARFVEIRDGGRIRSSLALVAARPFTWGNIRLHVVAGTLLGPVFVRRLGATAGSTVELLDGRGDVLTRSPAPDNDLPGAALLGLLPAPSAKARPLALPGDTGVQLQVHAGAHSLAVAQARIVGVLALFLLASVALATLLGAFLARRIVRPVEALAAGAATVARGDLSHRVDVRAGGEVGALVEAFNRMTADLLRERERAAVAERIAAWQEVARRLAHEIKNPLTPIAMSVETQLDAHRARSPLLDEIFEESSGAVLEEVGRLKKIVDEFSRFARLPPPQLEVIEPRQLVAPLLALYATAPAGIELRATVDEALPQVRADRDQILQVLLNLVQNGEQAMGGRGLVRLHAHLQEGGVAFDVDDRGPGLPASDRERIFEPWFTTKDAGTGLGLAIARRIAEEHGGSLEALEAPGGGARFRLLLPAA